MSLRASLRWGRRRVEEEAPALDALAGEANALVRSHSASHVDCTIPQGRLSRPLECIRPPRVRPGAAAPDEAR